LRVFFQCIGGKRHALETLGDDPPARADAAPIAAQARRRRINPAACRADKNGACCARRQCGEAQRRGARLCRIPLNNPVFE
jgi:hypothetical protein